MCVRSGYCWAAFWSSRSGESLLDVVEGVAPHLHPASRAARFPNCGVGFQDPLLNQAREIIAGLSIDEAHRVTKAFAIYFELTNLAETNHRKRRRRAAKLHAEQPALEGSFRGTFRRMRAACDRCRAGARALAEDKGRAGFYRPSHRSGAPHGAAQTPAHRQTTGASGSSALDRGRCQPFRSAIFAEVTSLWQTDEVRLEKPLVTDEIRMGLDHYSFSLFSALPRLYDEAARFPARGLRNRPEGFRGAGTTLFRFVDRRRSRWQSLRHACVHSGSPAACPECDHWPLHRRVGARYRPAQRFDSPGEGIRCGSRAAGEVQLSDGRRIYAPIPDFELRAVSPASEPDGRPTAQHSRGIDRSHGISDPPRNSRATCCGSAKAWRRTAGNAWPNW